MTLEQAALNLAVAGGLSSLIGFERQWRNRLAGLRTNTLVALGAASFVIYASLFWAKTVRPGSRRKWCPASAFSAPALSSAKD
jgi:uncharacterized membrane protein YhiD involved in acid resistance